MEEIALELALAAVTTLVAWGFKLLRTKVLADIKHTQIREVLDDVARAAEVVVSETSQKHVRQLKAKSGRWSREVGEILAQQATKKAKKIVGEKRIKEWVTAAELPIPYADERVRAHIEAAVKKQKEGKG